MMRSVNGLVTDPACIRYAEAVSKMHASPTEKRRRPGAIRPAASSAISRPCRRVLSGSTCTVFEKLTCLRATTFRELSTKTTKTIDTACAFRWNEDALQKALEPPKRCRRQDASTAAAVGYAEEMQPPVDLLVALRLSGMKLALRWALAAPKQQTAATGEFKFRNAGAITIVDSLFRSCT